MGRPYPLGALQRTHRRVTHASLEGPSPWTARTTEGASQQNAYRPRPTAAPCAGLRSARRVDRLRLQPLAGRPPGVGGCPRLQHAPPVDAVRLERVRHPRPARGELPKREEPARPRPAAARAEAREQAQDALHLRGAAAAAGEPKAELDLAGRGGAGEWGLGRAGEVGVGCRVGGATAGEPACIFGSSPSRRDNVMSMTDCAQGLKAAGVMTDDRTDRWS